MGSLRAPCRVEKVSFGTCGVGGHHDSYRINWRRRHRAIGRAPQVGLATATNGGQENAATGGTRASDGAGRADGGDRAVSEGGARIDGGLETSSLADDCDLDFNYWASVGDQAGGASGPSGRRLVLGCPWGH